MQRYANVSGKSGVTHFAIEPEAIVVWFGTQAYRYSYRSAGVVHVQTMKRLAVSGRGLGTYINQYVKNLFEPHGQGRAAGG